MHRRTACDAPELEPELEPELDFELELELGLELECALEVGFMFVLELGFEGGLDVDGLHEILNSRVRTERPVVQSIEVSS